ncbi:hypothetical protein TIFTF001_033380 [Ficus carica]|uniref:Uncharacterized protein n=1 Tax=Ficus carica TaxID=3494 RepID=A0AA88J726_FICCA|nr:hypothetical protein TIFTF001_033380 [Ficus carica]
MGLVRGKAKEIRMKNEEEDDEDEEQCSGVVGPGQACVRLWSDFAHELKIRKVKEEEEFDDELGRDNDEKFEDEDDDSDGSIFFLFDKVDLWPESKSRKFGEGNVYETPLVVGEENVSWVVVHPGVTEGSKGGHQRLGKREYMGLCF